MNVDERVLLWLVGLLVGRTNDRMLHKREENLTKE